MRFLNSSRVLENMNLLSSHLLKEDFDSIRPKSCFIKSVNTLQKTSFANESRAKVEFDNNSIAAFLLKNEVFNEIELRDNAHLIPSPERQLIIDSIDEALSMIDTVNPALLNLINSVIGSIGVYSIPERDGGSISNAIGLIWLSPLKNWNKEYYGEMLVHEFIHNCVFLEDMVRSIMPNTNLLEVEDALTISAIRQTRRPYDKAFHSACVVTGIMYYYNLIGQDNKALEFLPSLKNTLKGLRDSYERLANQNLFVLSQNGYDILNEMEVFATELNYSVFEDSLSMAQ